MSSDSQCGNLDNPDTLTGLRVASVFIILLCGTSGALFPVLAKKSSWLHVPKMVFEFAKYFGSGVIIATAFIHLLSPGLDELSSVCLSPAWQEYPYALALCLLSIMSIFILELVAFRWGTARLQRLNMTHDPHGHHVGSHAAHGPESTPEVPSTKFADKESQSIHEPDDVDDAAAAAQIIGVAILEFGVLLHSVLIGLTLAVDEAFKVLFVVIIFHQTFEGLGLGSRLAFIKLPPRYNYVPIAAAFIYGISTPIGIAVGLGIRSTYNPGSTTASIVSGVLDSLSAGILIYTGLVELLAHEFLFNKETINSSNGKLAYALGTMLFGCGIMALLGKWA
ncbi:ZIP-like iron-zinc transporter [Mycena maculata]|uniref:ZIP-like iron-zinc transporter n=1 Tax=Mycena maculata TaxID=230809 RepID=A0AAD7NLL3_9AGAR|nr:ZIP-like iron-zinc transporter [Mycena maculata]